MRTLTETGMPGVALPETVAPRTFSKTLQIFVPGGRDWTTRSGIS